MKLRFTVFVFAMVAAAGCVDESTQGPQSFTDNAPGRTLGPHVVGAYYFGVWTHDSKHWTIPAGRKTYGREDVWVGIRDFHGDVSHRPPVRQNTQDWRDDFSHLKPALGYYDVNDEKTLSQHINQAASHGLSFFSFYWYWNNEENVEHLNYGLDAFLEADNRDRLQFMISIVAHRFQPTFYIPEEDFEKVAEILVRRYLQQPNYLLTRSGRPLVFIEDSKGIGDGSAEAATTFIRVLRQCCRKLGIEPYVLVNPEVGKVVDDISVADGYSCLSFANLSLPNDGHDAVSQVGSYERYRDRLAWFYSGRYTDKPFMYCMATHIDHRPKTNLGHMKRDRLRYLTDWSPAGFRAALEQLRRFVDAPDASEIKGYVSLYSWNDWRECGFPLEPSEKHEDRSLSMVAEVFDLPVHGDPSCRILGVCHQPPCCPDEP